MVVNEQLIYFQKPDGECTIAGSVEGLSEGKHGFHIHQFGDYTNGWIYFHYITFDMSVKKLFHIICFF